MIMSQYDRTEGDPPRQVTNLSSDEVKHHPTKTLTTKLLPKGFFICKTPQTARLQRDYYLYGSKSLFHLIYSDHLVTNEL